MRLALRYTVNEVKIRERRHSMDEDGEAALERMLHYAVTGKKRRLERCATL